MQPLFLPRTLSYNRQAEAVRQGIGPQGLEPEGLEFQHSSAAGSLQLSLACSSAEAPLSAVAVLCDRVSDTVRAPAVTPSACGSL